MKYSCLFLLLLTACGQNKSPYLQKEFVCYDDGKLVERHVSVRWATSNQYGMWWIYYTDSEEAGYYRQDAGETCMIEVVQ
jgi:hypothetical protein